MEQRRVTDRNHWYHGTQSSTAEYGVLPLTPEAVKASNPFLLGVVFDEGTLAPFPSWLVSTYVLTVELLPDPLIMTRSQASTAYERLSTAPTVTQACGAQRLCNYYSARLTPLPGPDFSRGSNHRLAQIMQYARQLASSPSTIDNRLHQYLNGAGLTVRDCVIINQIIGFVGFQAWTIATFQVYLGYPVRWLSGLGVQSYADASLSADESLRWRSSYKMEKLLEGHTKSSAVELCQLTETLSLHPISLSLLEKLSNSARVNTQPDNRLTTLLCARINGNPTCFAACMNSLDEYKKVSPFLRKGEGKANR